MYNNSFSSRKKYKSVIKVNVICEQVNQEGGWCDTMNVIYDMDAMWWMWCDAMDAMWFHAMDAMDACIAMNVMCDMIDS